MPRPRQSSRLTRTREWVRLRTRSADERQLDALRTTFSGQLYRRAKAARDAGTSLGTWGEAADSLLSEAEVALRRYDFETSWACYREARRMEIFAYTPDELHAERMALHAEASRPGHEASWRNAAITNLLAAPDESFASGLARLVTDSAVADKVEALLAGAGGDEGPGIETLEHIAGLLEDTGVARPAETARAIGGLALQRDQAVRTAVYAAAALRDEEGTREAHGLMRLRRQLLVLGAMLVCILISLLLLATMVPIALQGRPSAAGDTLWLYVALFGALGGGLSAFRALTGRVSRHRAPKHLLSSLLTMVRPLLGTIPALGAYVTLESGILGFKPASTAAVLATAFVAGLAERLIARAVEPSDLPLEAESEHDTTSQGGPGE